jgi:hypothetical protein
VANIAAILVVLLLVGGLLVAGSWGTSAPRASSIQSSSAPTGARAASDDFEVLADELGQYWCEGAWVCFRALVLNHRPHLLLVSKHQGTVRMPPNRSFDTDTQRHCAARRAGEHTPRGPMPLRAGQLRR